VSAISSNCFKKSSQSRFIGTDNGRLTIDIAKKTQYSFFLSTIEKPNYPVLTGLRFILALLNPRYASWRSRFNRVNHCGVLVSTPHSSRFVSLVPSWRESFLLCRPIFRLFASSSLLHILLPIRFLTFI
jgi:thiamine pyrophosphokinase